MIEAWGWRAYIGMVLGLVAAVLLFVPILVWQSRRFGRLSAARTVASGAAAVYGVTVLAYTLLPLPATDWCDRHTTPAVQLDPLHSIGDVARATEGLSGAQALRSFALLQVVMNVVLFIPWGAFSRRLFGHAAWLGIATGFALSVLIEVTQGTGVWWAYDCAYRYADIDDVIANTLGAAVGVLLAPALLWWVPHTKTDVATRGEPRPVTRVRRLAGMVIDGAAFAGLWAVLTLGYRLVVRFGLHRTPSIDGGWMDRTVPGLIAAVVVIVAPALIGSRASIGQRAVWLAPCPAGGMGRALVRLLVGIGGYAAVALLGSVPGLPADLRSLTTVVAWLLVGLSVAFAAFDPTARGLSYRLSGSDIVDRRSWTTPPREV